MRCLLNSHAIAVPLVFADLKIFFEASKSTFILEFFIDNSLEFEK